MNTQVHTLEYYVHVKNNSVFHDTPESYEIVEFDDAIGRWENLHNHLTFGFQNGRYTVWKFQNFAITQILREINFVDS